MIFAYAVGRDVSKNDIWILNIEKNFAYNLEFNFDESSVNFDVIQIEFELKIFDHRKKSLVSDICDLRVDELQMLDESMSRPRRPILTPQTFSGIVGIEDNEFVLKNAFVWVSNDLYVFVVVIKLGHEISNALLNHLLHLKSDDPCGKPLGGSISAE